MEQKLEGGNSKVAVKRIMRENDRVGGKNGVLK